MRPVSLTRHLPFAALALLGAVAQPCGALAQTAAPSSQLQLQPTDAGTALATAMTRLAASPRDVDALIRAGEASLELEDPRSALGFFGRADDVTPDNGRVKAGLGRAMLQLDQVGDGLRLMELAGNLGYSDFGLLADRGLARDLAANQAGAQADYIAALRFNPNDQKVIRRLAVSYGIAGQVDLAEKTIQPLLYKSDRAAWRDKAFILAMNGRTSEAVGISGKVMPTQLATAIKPYLERMAMLNPAQRAAAVHLGRFPPGLVNVQMASNGASPPPQERVSQASPPPPMPVPEEATPPARTVASAPQARPAPPPAAKPAPASAAPQARASGTQVAIASPASRPVQGPPAPPQEAQRAVSPPPAPVPPRPATRPGTSTRTLADIMAEIEVPQSELRPTAAVDLNDLAALKAAKKKAEALAAKKKAEAEAKAKADAEKKRLAANPARYWVQIGTGKNRSALAFTLKRMKKEHDALGGKDGWSASWGATNRLIVGPFKNLDKAKAVEADLKKAGSDAFVWRSDAGEEVEALGGN
jgi:Flp pilus assembly protein TadD